MSVVWPGISKLVKSSAYYIYPPINNFEPKTQFQTSIYIMDTVVSTHLVVSTLNPNLKKNRWEVIHRKIRPTYEHLWLSKSQKPEIPEINGSSISMSFQNGMKWWWCVTRRDTQAHKIATLNALQKETKKLMDTYQRHHASKQAIAQSICKQ